MQDLIVNIMGYSGAGKDTLATMLTLLDDRYHRVKFAAPIKREVEQRFGLPTGFLEHRKVKGHQFDYSTDAATYGALLVELYHATKDCSIDYKIADTPSIISMCHVYGLVPIITDCRNHCEGRLLSQYNNVVHVWVNGGQQQSSDELQDCIYNNFPATHQFCSVENTHKGGLSNLLYTAHHLHDTYLR